MLRLDAAFTVWRVHPAILAAFVMTLIDPQPHQGLQYLLDLLDAARQAPLGAGKLYCIAHILLICRECAALWSFELDEYRNRVANPGLVSRHKDLEVRPAKPGPHLLELLLKCNVPGPFVWTVMKHATRRQSKAQPLGNLFLQLVLSHV